MALARIANDKPKGRPGLTAGAKGRAVAIVVISRVRERSSNFIAKVLVRVLHYSDNE